MNLVKGKLYEMIWENPHTSYHYMSMNTKYNRNVVHVWNGSILLYLGSRKINHVIPTMNGNKEIKVWERRHKFLFKQKVLTWTEREQDHHNWGFNRLDQVFKLIETTTK